MKLRDLFSRKPVVKTQSDGQTTNTGSHAKLDLGTLDDCVGGQAETDGVGCYAHSRQSNVH